MAAVRTAKTIAEACKTCIDRRGLHGVEVRVQPWGEQGDWEVEVRFKRYAIGYVFAEFISDSAPFLWAELEADRLVHILMKAGATPEPETPPAGGG
jgi:hypothetical protein